MTYNDIPITAKEHSMLLSCYLFITDIPSVALLIIKYFRILFDAAVRDELALEHALLVFLP